MNARIFIALWIISACGAVESTQIKSSADSRANPSAQSLIESRTDSIAKNASSVQSASQSETAESHAKSAQSTKSSAESPAKNTSSVESTPQDNELKVSAQSFHSQLQKGVTELKGEVVITKGEDKLYADKVIIHSNRKNQPQKYTATGNVRFFANAQERKMKGRAKKAIYDVAKDEYQLIDNALIEEVNTKNIIKGSTIIFNPKTQQATVQGSSSKPSTMSFIIENGKE